MDTKRTVVMKTKGTNGPRELIGFLYREDNTIYIAIPMGDPSDAREVRDLLEEHGFVSYGRTESATG